MNEKVDVQIAGRRLTVQMEGWTALQILALAETVTDRIRQAERDNTTVAATSKLELLAALHLAAELSSAQDVEETERRVATRKIEELTLALRAALAAAGK